MDAREHATTKGGTRRTNSDRLCPECGAIMTEVDLLVEGSNVFVWYMCNRMVSNKQ